MIWGADGEKETGLSTCGSVSIGPFGIPLGAELPVGQAGVGNAGDMPVYCWEVVGDWWLVAGWEGEGIAGGQWLVVCG